MTLQEYMNENFTVIDATSQGMSLQEAIEEVKNYCDGDTFSQAMFFPNVRDKDTRTAIATILNAVVKGELK